MIIKPPYIRSVTVTVLASVILFLAGVEVGRWLSYRELRNYIKVRFLDVDHYMQHGVDFNIAPEDCSSKALEILRESILTDYNGLAGEGKRDKLISLRSGVEYYTNAIAENPDDDDLKFQFVHLLVREEDFNRAEKVAETIQRPRSAASAKELIRQYREDANE